MATKRTPAQRAATAKMLAARKAKLKPPAKKKRTPAQRAATAKMLAARKAKLKPPVVVVKRRPRQAPKASMVAPGKLRKILAEERRRLLKVKRDRLAAVREECKRAKAKTRERRKRQKERLIHAWIMSKDADLRAIERSCKERKELIAKTYEKGRDRTRALAAAAKAEREAKAVHRRTYSTQAQIRGRKRAAEKRAENIDFVRQEIQAVAPHLVPYFERIKGRLKAKPNVSLAEQVLESAEAHRDEVIEASQRAADRQVSELVRQGESKWKQQAQKIEGALCSRATRDARAGRLFKFKSTELKALERLGMSPDRIARECYNAKLSKRRKVSQRLQEAPF